MTLGKKGGINEAKDKMQNKERTAQQSKKSLYLNFVCIIRAQECTKTFFAIGIICLLQNFVSIDGKFHL